MKILYFIVFIFGFIFSSNAQNRVTVYRSDGLHIKYYLRNNGFISKSEHLNENNKSKIIYHYSNQKLSNIEVLGDEFYDLEVEKKIFNDVSYQIGIMKKYNIKYPLPYINSNELNDTAIMLILYPEFKFNEKKTVKKNTIILSFEMNSAIFFKSHIEAFIPTSSIIKSYEINIKNKLPLYEKFVYELSLEDQRTFKVKDGILVRKYKYRNDKLISISYFNGFSQLEEMKKFSYK